MQEFFCFISVILKEQLLKNIHLFYSFKVQHVSNFTIIEEENVPPLQEYTILSHGKIIFY